MKSELAKFYTARKHLFAGRKLFFDAEGHLDLVNHGCFTLQADLANAGRFTEVKHLNGTTAPRPDFDRPER